MIIYSCVYTHTQVSPETFILSKKVLSLLLNVSLNTTNTHSAPLKNHPDLLTQFLPLVPPTSNCLHKAHWQLHPLLLPHSSRLHVKYDIHKAPPLTTVSHLFLSDRYNMRPVMLNGSLRGFSLCQHEKGQQSQGSGWPSSTTRTNNQQINRTHTAALSTRSVSSAPHTHSRNVFWPRTASWNDLCPRKCSQMLHFFGLWWHAKETDRQRLACIKKKKALIGHRNKQVASLR